LPQKVIIIGARGMLGQDLAKTYREDKTSKIITWDFEDLDITDQKQVLTKIKKADPDVVINAAAYNAVDKAEESEGFKIAIAVNAAGPENLAVACKKIGAVFVTYSSDYVFRGDQKEGYREDDQPGPASKYGLSKFEGEKRVREIGGDYYIIRTSKLFGKIGTGKEVKKSFVDTMIELSDKLPELKVVDEEVSCFTYTPDLAKVTRFLLEGNFPPGIYHITNSDPCTWYECAKTIFEILEKKVRLIPVPASEFPRPAKRPQYSILLNTKLPPIRSYKEALAEFLTQHKKRLR
jgi:dTDP-4-dehydrorhamnose reductase